MPELMRLLDRDWLVEERESELVIWPYPTEAAYEAPLSGCSWPFYVRGTLDEVEELLGRYIEAAAEVRE